MLQTIVMGLINVIFTVVAILTVDKWGRKPLLIIGSIGMSIGMFAISALAYNEIIGISTLVFIIIYTASFMMSWGPFCWVLISEFFPNKIRGKAVAIAVTSQWAANFLISSTYPPMMNFSSAFTYGFYGTNNTSSAYLTGLLLRKKYNKFLPEYMFVFILALISAKSKPLFQENL
jgi:SP family xylose:H+ symportor-like MFS transporter